MSFSLPETFIEKYKDREVDWGFKDAGGNALGELTFIRTYSRIKEDGTKEQWWEVCKRVIEGMYSIQKDYVKSNRLPWNDRKAQASAQEAYERMFTFKWTPPGRGLWMLGSSFIHDTNNGAALQNCFAGEVEYITNEGIKTFEDTVGTKQTVLSRNGKWIESEIKSFGQQELMKITFSRQGVEKVVYATPGHRWFIKDKRGSNRKGNVWKEVFTSELKDVHRVQEVYGQGLGNISLSPIGIAHGFCYGDGRFSIGDRNSNSVTLFGDKDKALASYFEGHPSRPDRGGIEFSSLPNYFRTIPVGENKSYIVGWLAGYFAADGSVTENGLPIMTSYDLESIKQYRSLAALVGIGTGEIRQEKRISNLTGREHDSYRLTLEPHTLTEDFFIGEEHRNRFNNRSIDKNRYWNVKSVEYTDRYEEVYCAIVPGEAAFTLSSNILTGNCAFISTADIDRNDPGYVFAWVMDALMLGVGVGWDTKGKDKGLEIYKPTYPMSGVETHVIPDTREGWADSVRILINQYLKSGQKYVEFDYSEIRPQGAPIRGFGGTASGPAPLIDIHLKMRQLLSADEGKTVGSRLIADLMNLIGTCVVAGNVRRSAEIGLGDPDDEDFINLKNAEVFPERNSYDPENPGWGWMSNNTLSVKVGQDYDRFTDLIATNGEPGFIWMDTAREFGRLLDPANNKDRRVAGVNPCAEQTLESFECCTLVEVHINRAESKEDFLRTLKFAYLYGKTITLLNTHWDRTNAVMKRNRRIGASVTGVSGFYDTNGLPVLREWWNEGYEEIQRRDHEYSEWLGVRESVKTTSIKPSGTVSLLSGATPGVHWPPGGKHYLRAIRFAADDPMVPKFMLAGYTVEQDVVSRNTVVVYFPIETNVRGEKEVSIFEKINLASEAQRHWADNAVSATISFDKKLEAEYIPTVLNMYEGKLKTISFLPMGNDVYQQQPYTSITEEEYSKYVDKLRKINMDDAYLNGTDAEGERYCATSTCEIKAEEAQIKGA
jgi:ribonucleoside-triphosphate reductase (thioredoxin)